ncbi:acyl carrier protein [Couchioplanes azureus]|uniref:acyl carrier protein n=1 Tax=Couchioplanes caeruleus TaxID=56438 RepID=UPI00166FB9ED|nr:acyl carrier protein [Couchioplanes caeruleus]GGQ65172.1 coronafacic acid synthetase [Couchioplanes caeruleus subsp. azureus]
MSDNVEQTICKIMNTELFVETPADRIDLDESLRDGYGLDSLGFVELRVQCEDLFAVQIGDDDFTPENFSTVRSVANLVRKLQGVPA